MDELYQTMQVMGKQARQSADALARVTTRQKNTALEEIAALLLSGRNTLLLQNQKDLEAGEKKGLDAPLLDRLTLTEERIESMADGLMQIARLPDPVGAITGLNVRPSGIQVGQMRVPLGVVGIVYESRPNVTADAAGLCIKSGNAVILRGGSESIHSNLAIADVIGQALIKSGLPIHTVQLVKTTERSLVGHMLGLIDYIDVIIPRGGKGLTQRISDESKIPVIKHLDGICHVYLHSDADFEKASDIALNAKVQRTGVCNAMETLLVDHAIAAKILPGICARFQQHSVELRGCNQTREMVPTVLPATDEDWSTEYLDSILSIKVVADVDQAIAHINTYGSHHTDAVVTENYSVARRFLREVDSSSVMVNASTRFADGYEYGLGAEIGISTNKLHARGPVGLEGLTTLKYVVLGNGEVRV